MCISLGSEAVYVALVLQVAQQRIVSLSVMEEASIDHL